jgi:catechol 2,3-dioxygenase-like lactoylglutathione lyase family enzyme
MDAAGDLAIIELRIIRMPQDPANSTAIGVTAFLHSSVTVSDVERSIRFYRDVLGMEVCWCKAGGKPTFIREEKQSYVAGVTGYRNAHLKIAMLRYGQAMLELIEYVEPREKGLDPGTHRPGSPHLAFIVADIDRAWNTLKAQSGHWGLSFVGDGPALVDRGPNTGGRAFYFRDPDGIAIEIVELNTGWTRGEI